LEIRGSMASVFVLLEAFNRKEAAALGFFPCATASIAIKVYFYKCRLIPGSSMRPLAHIQILPAEL